MRLFMQLNSCEAFWNLICTANCRVVEVNSLNSGKLPGRFYFCEWPGHKATCYPGLWQKSVRRWFVCFSNFLVVIVQRCSSEMLTVLMLVTGLDDDWCGWYRHLTYLEKSFWVCHLCTHNVAAILFWGHPLNMAYTVSHDTYRTIQGREKGREERGKGG